MEPSRHYRLGYITGGAYAVIHFDETWNRVEQLAGEGADNAKLEGQVRADYISGWHDGYDAVNTPTEHALPAVQKGKQ